MIIVGLDWESYYKTGEFSLSKQTTEEYIRDPRFEAICVSTMIGDAPVQVHDQPDIEAAMESIPWDDALLVAHNCSWDAAVCSFKYGRTPKAYACTLSIARALGQNLYGGASLGAQVLVANQFGADLPIKDEKIVNEFNGYRRKDFSPDQIKRYMKYCGDDTISTVGLLNFYCEVLGFPAFELQACSEVIDMFARPRLRLDRHLLAERLVAVRNRRDSLLERLGVTITQIRSDEVFANLLIDAGVEPPTKLSPKRRDKKGEPLEVYAFAKSDDGFIALQSHESDLVQSLVAARLKAKSTLEEGRMIRLMDIATRGLLPMPYQYYAAHTGRVASMGGSKINVANLPRSTNPTKLDEGMIVKMGTEFPAVQRINNTGSKFTIADSSDIFFSKQYKLASLRDCIMAPKGEILVVSDSSQIEARILAWITQEEYLLELFRKFNADPKGEEDTYTTLASDIYGVRVTKKDEDKRFVGKEARLGLGYQMGAPKFQRSIRIKAKISLDDEFCKNVVNVYRAVNPMTVAFWKRCGGALQEMLDGNAVDLGRPGMAIALPADDKDPMPRIQLPNGMCLRYPGLMVERGDRGKKFAYMQAKGRNQVKSNIYGGKMTEGCIAGHTPVLTDSGWVRLDKVAITDKVYDGVQFVTHGGLVNKGVQACVTVDGVIMTTDHEVLTDEGWIAALEKPRPFRPDLRAAGSAAYRVERRKEDEVAIQMPVRDALCEDGSRRDEIRPAWRHSELRVPVMGQHEHHARHDKSPFLSRVAKYVGSVLKPEEQSVAALRRARDNCLQSLVKVREFLVGHGGLILGRATAGPQGQQRWVQQEELSVGDGAAERYEQMQHGTQDRRRGAEQADRDKPHDALLPVSAWLAPGQTNPAAFAEQQVFDLMDAGPRQRFVVMGNTGPMIVHNCCQAMARIVITDQWLRVKKRAIKEGISVKSPIVGHTYDEIIASVKKEMAQDMKAIMIEEMSKPPSFMPGIPVACECKSAERYGDAK